MHEYQLRLLNSIKGSGGSDVESIIKATGLDRGKVMWAIETLAEKKAITTERGRLTEVQLTEEGRGYLEEFPEERLVKSLAASDAADVSGIRNNLGLLWAKRNGWITIEGNAVKQNQEGRKAAAKGFKYDARLVLVDLSGMGHIGQDYMKLHSKEIGALEKRKLIRVSEKDVISRVSMTERGRALLASEDSEGVGQLTKAMISSGSWKKVKLKRYDVGAPSEDSYAARLHPVREFMDYVRHAWLDMGFVEVSGPIVDSAFWNFDVLFAPQDHPTREMQDTFFLSNPREIDVDDLALLERVKKMHKSGWERVWKEELSKQALLRTHSTSVSAHYMYRFSKAMESDYPVRLFSIGRVFRNESIDYKHLAELIQFDGIIIGDNLNLAHLIHTLKTFYQNLGFDAGKEGEGGGLEFRPSYFPFVEPGLEARYYDRDRKEWIELIGGGIIRKEITKAIGINKTVLAWGGGLDRLFLKFMKIDALTTLYKNEIGWLRSRKRLEL